MNRSQQPPSTRPEPAPAPAGLSHGTVAVFRQKPDFTFAWLDPAAAELAGVPTPSWGKFPADFWKLVHEEDRLWLKERLEKEARSHDWIATPFRIRHWLTGRVCHLLELRRALGSARQPRLGYEGLWLDQTPLRQAERRLAIGAGQETLAQLTAGYAHDVKNVLAGLGSLAELCLMEIDGSHPLQANLAMIKQNTRRISQLVEDLSRLALPNSPRRAYHDLRELGRETLRLARPAVARWISLEGRWGDLPLPVCLDETEFRQALFHLVFNAAAATPGPGHITLETSRQDAAPSDPLLEGAIPKCPAACLTVIDEGKGIAPVRGRRIFDLYYSDGAGKAGVGLGLAHVRRFVLAHHGAVTLRSAPGQGSRFQVWLPLAEFNQAELQAGSTEQTPARILLAGPPGPVRERVAAVLDEMGTTAVRAQADPDLTLLCGEEAFAALFLFPGKEIGPAQSLVGLVRKQRMPLRIILVTETVPVPGPEAFLKQVDWILDATERPELFREKIRACLEQGGVVQGAAADLRRT